MILPFSTQINGKPTYFVERIIGGLFDADINNDLRLPPSFSYEKLRTIPGKIHSIREDKNDRWRPGIIIDFFINVRQKNMLRFAPKIPVTTTQRFCLEWHRNKDSTVARIYIDRRSFACVIWNKGHEDNPIITGKLLEFAQNDGFDTIDEFFKYFNTDFKGKLIHWTNKTYT